MTRADRAVAAILFAVLIALGAAITLDPVPVAAPATPIASPSMPAPAVYREGVVGRPVSITPLTARNRAERALVGLVFSGLVRLGSGGGVQPDLAASWTTDDDGRTWTFRLRPGATWHDGVPVTADDVVFTVGALRSPELPGPGAASWAEVEATAVAPDIVRLTLATPLGGFLEALTQPILPAHLLGDLPLADLAEYPFSRDPVGTGPFALVSLDADRAVLAPARSVAPPATPDASATPDSLATPVPTPDTRAPVPYLDQIEMRFYDDPAALEAAFRAGEVDGAAGLPVPDAVALADETGTRVLRYPTTTLSTVVLNLRPDHRELRDAGVRRALLAAIDRDALILDALGGGGLRASTLVPPASWAFDDTIAVPVPFDPEAAATLLREAGWTQAEGGWTAPDGSAPFEPEILAPPAIANPGANAAAKAVALAWRTFGVPARLVEVEPSDLAARLREGSFTSAVVDIGFGLDPDLYPLLASTQVAPRGGNVAGYQDPGLDRLLAAARAPGAEAERAAAWRELLAGLAERQPILPLAWRDEVVVQRGVEGVHVRLISAPGDRFWDVLAWRLAADR